MVAEDSGAIGDRGRRLRVARDALDQGVELVPLPVRQRVPFGQCAQGGQRLRSRSIKSA